LSERGGEKNGFYFAGFSQPGFWCSVFGKEMPKIGRDRIMKTGSSGVVSLKDEILIF
jgi:hypothetical protein